MRPGDDALRAQDAAARVAAQTVFATPVVLEAGAGTGKTTALVARVVAWCVGPGWEKAESTLRRSDEPAPTVDRVATHVASRVLAITYTEAAAAEMATRIVRVISDLASGLTPSEKLLDDGLPPPALRQRRAAALVGAVDRITVRTIHGFCHRVLSAHPLEAGLHPAFVIDADNREIEALAHRTVESALRSAVAIGDDPAWRSLSRDGIGPADVSSALVALIEIGVPPEALAQPAYDTATIDALLAPVRDAADVALPRLAALANAKGRSNARLVVAALEASCALLAGERPSDAASFAVVVRALDDLWGVSQAPRLMEKLEAWTAGDEGFTANERAALGEGLSAAQAAAQHLHAALEDVVHLAPERFERMRVLLEPLLAESSSELRRSGIVTFNALLRHARDLVVNRPDVAERLRDGIDQLLVDEFQDTDPVQCALVRALALDPAAKALPGLFLVGDPKQSIFGWRSADLAAYQGMVERVEAMGGRRYALSVNYRSVGAVLDEVERVTEPLLQHVPGEQAGFQRLLADRSLPENPGFSADGRAPIEHWLSCRLDENRQPRATHAVDAVAVEAPAIAREIEWLHRVHGVAWKDVALLFRAMGDSDRYLAELRSRDIPYDVVKDRSYFQRREVIDASALVRCVLDPNDALALVTWLRSVSGGVPDAAWLPLWRRKFPDEMAKLHGPNSDSLAALHAMLDEVAASLAPMEVPRLERVRDWPAAAAHAIATIGRLRHSFAIEPVDVFVDRLRVLAGQERLEAGRYLARHRLANLDRFFRELLDRLASGNEPAAALRALREGTSAAGDVAQGTPSEGATDAVRVLTIHGAKGLQFRHVYCVQLHKSRSAARSGDQAVVGEHDGRRVFSLFGVKGPGFAAFDRARERRDAREARRLLYVAMTRAQDRLVLAGLWPTHGLRSNATTLIGLFGQRLAMGATVDHLHRAMEGDPAAERFVHDAATWVIPERAANEPTRRAEVHASNGFDLERIRRDVAWLASRRNEALDGRDVPRLVTASSLAVAHAPAASTRSAASVDSSAAHTLARSAIASHELAAEARESDEPCSDGETFASPSRAASGDDAATALRDEAVYSADEAADPVPRFARAIGSAVHRALEVLNIDAIEDGGAERARLEAVIDATLAGLIPAHREDVRARALALLDRALAPGGVVAQLRERAGEIVARELPVLLQRESPRGVVVGTIDLLYRDRGSGQLVVADWKTDRVTAEAAIARAGQYRAQGEVYVDAARRALGDSVAPRFELWFVDAGAIVTLDLDR